MLRDPEPEQEFTCETCGTKYRSHEDLITHGRRVGHVVDRESGGTNPQGADEEEGERGPLSEAAARAAGVVRRDEGSCLLDLLNIIYESAALFI